MIYLFKSVSAAKAALLILIFFVFKYFLALSIPTITGQDIFWMQIGARCYEGFLMYRDTWDLTAPFAAAVYTFSYALSGNHALFMHFFALGLVAFQALLFNRLILQSALFEKRSLLPALCYLTYHFCFFDQLSLSPELLANSFLIPALLFVLLQIRDSINKDYSYKIGLCLGMAFLCHFPSVIFLIFALLSLGIFSGIKRSAQLRVLLIFLAPFLGSIILFFWLGAWRDFLTLFFQPIFLFIKMPYVSFYSLVLIYSSPLIVSFWGAIKMRRIKFNNFQKRGLQTILFFSLFGTIIALFSSSIAPHSFLFVVPGLSLLSTFFFLNIRRIWLKESIYLILLLALFFNLINADKAYWNVEYTQDLMLKDADKQHVKLLENKKILVLGHDFSFYQYGSAASAFLNWTISSQRILSAEDVQEKIAVYQNFVKMKPDRIVDPQQKFLIVFRQYPFITDQYRKSDISPDVWLKK